MNPRISCRVYKIKAISMSMSCKYHSLINNSNNNKSIVKSINKSMVSCNSMSCRHLFGFPIKPPTPSNPFSSKVKKYRERRVLGYSKEQLFDVVFRVEDYPLFVPACVKSKIIEQNHSYVRADLEIGIPPLIWEKYTSRVTFDRPNIINAKCIDGKLFKHLETQWKFTDGLPHLKNSCTLDFSLSFEFRSYLHSHLVHVFFDEMARQTVNAFLKRAEILYGKQNFYLSNELPNKT